MVELVGQTGGQTNRSNWSGSVVVPDAGNVLPPGSEVPGNCERCERTTRAHMTLLHSNALPVPMSDQVASKPYIYIYIHAKAVFWGVQKREVFG